jgi:hypothetical protein
MKKKICSGWDLETRSLENSISASLERVLSWYIYSFVWREMLWSLPQTTRYLLEKVCRLYIITTFFTYVGESFCLNCYIKTTQKSEESDDSQKDPTFIHTWYNVQRLLKVYKRFIPWNGRFTYSKQQAAKGSLQCPYDEQILTPEDFYEFAQENIHGIKHSFVTETNSTETESKERFSTCTEIPNSIGGGGNFCCCI